MGIDEDDTLIEFADVAGRFLRSGGSWSWTTFRCFSDAEQEIAAQLAEELVARRAVAAGRSVTDEGAASVLAPYDDGEEIARVALAGFMDSLP